MAKPDEPTFTLKVMTNKQKTKVLFAEADSNFTDILLGFLTLPLGKISKLLEDHKAPDFGSVSNLYRSVANLDSTFFVNEAAKLMLLNSRSSFEDVCPDLELGSQPVKYYTCDGRYCHDEIYGRNISIYYGSGTCSSCEKPLHGEIIIGDSKAGDSDSVGFTINTVSFAICDDLRVRPYGLGFLQTLKHFGIADTNGAELRSIEFGIEAVIGLLKSCLLSDTPLTDLVFNNAKKPSSVEGRINPIVSLKRKRTEDGNSKNIMLKIVVQKSTKKLVFAQSEADFVEVLFSFLTIPLGGVESLLGGNTRCKNVDNLYQSLASIDNKYFRALDLKSRLLNPKLAPGYSSGKQFLPLDEESPPTLYVRYRILYYNKKLNDNYLLVHSFKSPKGSDNYVKDPSTSYMITDDLTVTPFCLTSAIGFLDHLNIPVSDVEEVEVNIGLEEVLGILKASLTSTCALSGGLINHLPKKPVKSEH